MPPNKLGDYEILEDLGAGTMGRVYRAYDPALDREVALKTVNISVALSGDKKENFKERFIREAKTAGSLAHPGIITIHEIGKDEESDLPFIVMEFVSGTSLKEIIESSSSLTVDRILDIAKQIADALDYAHSREIVHRDIKPSNIFITSRGDVKIMDFGIAKVPTSELTGTDTFLGTPYYMSPEQISNENVDGRSDLFSLGVVLYRLLTRQVPFEGDNTAAVTYSVVHKEPEPPSNLVSGISSSLEDIVMKLLRKNPEERFQSGGELIDAVESLSEDAGEEEKESKEEGIEILLNWLECKRSKEETLKLFGLGALIVLSASLFLVVFTANNIKKTSQDQTKELKIADKSSEFQSEKKTTGDKNEPPGSQEMEKFGEKKSEKKTKEVKKGREKEEADKESSKKKKNKKADRIKLKIRLKHDLGKSGGTLGITEGKRTILSKEFPKSSEKKIKSFFRKLGLRDEVWKGIDIPVGKHDLKIRIESDTLDLPQTLTYSCKLEKSDSGSRFLIKLKNGRLTAELSG